MIEGSFASRSVPTSCSGVRLRRRRKVPGVERAGQVLLDRDEEEGPRIAQDPARRRAGRRSRRRSRPPVTVKWTSVGSLARRAGSGRPRGPRARSRRRRAGERARVGVGEANDEALHDRSQDRTEEQQDEAGGDDEEKEEPESAGVAAVIARLRPVPPVRGSGRPTRDPPRGGGRAVAHEATVGRRRLAGRRRSRVDAVGHRPRPSRVRTVVARPPAGADRHASSCPGSPSGVPPSRPGGAGRDGLADSATGETAARRASSSSSRMTAAAIRSIRARCAFRRVGPGGPPELPRRAGPARPSATWLVETLVAEDHVQTRPLRDLDRPGPDRAGGWTVDPRHVERKADDELADAVRGGDPGDGGRVRGGRATAGDGRERHRPEGVGVGQGQPDAARAEIDPEEPPHGALDSAAGTDPAGVTDPPGTGVPADAELDGAGDAVAVGPGVGLDPGAGSARHERRAGHRWS